MDDCSAKSKKDDKAKPITGKPLSSPIAENDTVKSTAVVKYSSVEPVAEYSKLKADTDLKLPPADWLHSNTRVKDYKIWGKKSTQFSSFDMVNTSPDVLGKVDVVSASENIKHLLKIPFSKSQVSMAVHCVGKTLLLDEFDIYEYLRNAPEAERNHLRDFILKEIQNLKGFYRKRKTRDDLRNKSLLSKFLHYSIGSVSGKESSQSSESYTLREAVDTSSKSERENMGQSATATLLPTFTPDDPLPKPEASEFARQVLWQFEDCTMFIGTDLPIFGGGKFPAVSLRLRDMNEPINVLTGLDFWLDNLIANVPELAMCYHLNGIVQSYELMKTEEIPFLPDSQFSPTLIKDIAQNILSFLKSRCTKEGHTYWLFKGADDDVVKLYDLTSLLPEETTSSSGLYNPYSVPVAMLLYRIARNMRHPDNTHREKNTVCKLLKSCLKLLDFEQNAELVVSACSMLSDLCLSGQDDQQPASPSKAKAGNKLLPKLVQSSQMQVDGLRVPGAYCGDNRPELNPKDDTIDEIELAEEPDISGSVREKCLCALSYVVQGLTILKSSNYGKNKESENLSQTQEMNSQTAENQSVANGDSNVKMADLNLGNNYQTLTDAKELLVLAQKELLTGKEKPKYFLLQKAFSAYFSLAKLSEKEKLYGWALKYCRLALYCWDCSVFLTRDEEEETSLNILIAMLELYGDCHVKISTHNQSSEDCTQHDMGQFPNDQAIYQTCTETVAVERYCWTSQICGDREESLLASVKCYQAVCMEVAHSRAHHQQLFTRVVRKLGNSQNELGVLYMNRAAQIQSQTESIPSKKDRSLWERSWSCFESGIELFKTVDDSSNISLLYLNSGRLMRVCAQAFVTVNDSTPFTPQEEQYYDKAADMYKKAFQELEERRKQPSIWDAVSWELSSTYFTMAKLLQDHAPLNRMTEQEVSKEVTDLMDKALHYSSTMDEDSAQFPLCQYRMASIHYRLASMYHNSYRNQSKEQKKKHSRSLAEFHYGKAVNLFGSLERPEELLRAQLEQVAMYEQLCNDQVGIGAKIRAMEMALGIIAQTLKVLEEIERQCSSDPEENDSNKTNSGHIKEERENSTQVQLKGGNSTPELPTNGLDKPMVKKTFDTAVDYSKPSKDIEERNQLLNILESRVRFVLLNLVKLHSSRKGKQNDHSQAFEQYKSMYSFALMKDTTSNQLCANLQKVIQNIQQNLMKS